MMPTPRKALPPLSREDLLGIGKPAAVAVEKSGGAADKIVDAFLGNDTAKEAAKILLNETVPRLFRSWDLVNDRAELKNQNKTRDGGKKRYIPGRGYE